MRVFEYNITGLEHHNFDQSTIPAPAPFDFNSTGVSIDGKKKQKKKKKAHKKYKFTVPEAPSKSSVPGPAYSPQTFSLLRYQQYFANLTYINNDFTQDLSGTGASAAKWHEGKHKGKKPHEKDHKPTPRKFKYEVLYDTKEDKVYHLDDLTVPSMIELARRIGDFKAEGASETDEDGHVENECREVSDQGKKKEKKKHGKKKHHKGGKKHRHRQRNEAWYTFVRRAYVDTMSPEELEDEFGC